MRTTGMGGHQSARMMKDEWLTPRNIIEALGPFDLDPCAPIVRPWDTARTHFTTIEDGLAREWKGRVWLNPPYGDSTDAWLQRMACHNDGIALIFARTETETWFEWVWPEASGILFLKGRLFFHHVTGERAKHNAGAPSALIAYGVQNREILFGSDLAGQRIPLTCSTSSLWVPK